MASVAQSRSETIPKCRRLEGRHALVTGGARGIGLAISRRLAAEGARVLMVDRDEHIASVADMLDQPHLVIDLLETEAVDRMFDHADEVLGSLDVLVNNAAITKTADIIDLEVEDFDRIMALNARVPMLAVQAAAKRMIKEGRGGSIINISSVSGKLGVPGQVAYGMSKGAVRQLTTSTAVALAKHEIRVNAVAPGTIETELAKSVMGDQLRQTVLSRTPLQRLGEPDEIAAAVAFLASDDASYITGQTLYVDGGRLSLNMIAGQF